MNALAENLLISVCTGAISAGTLILQVEATDRDWVAVGTTFVIAFAGSLINGLRQLQKEPPK